MYLALDTIMTIPSARLAEKPDCLSELHLLLLEVFCSPNLSCVHLMREHIIPSKRTRFLQHHTETRTARAQVTPDE